LPLVPKLELGTQQGGHELKKRCSTAFEKEIKISVNPSEEDFIANGIIVALPAFSKPVHHLNTGFPVSALRMAKSNYMEIAIATDCILFPPAIE
jgi:hypothetical protein